MTDKRDSQPSIDQPSRPRRPSPYDNLAFPSDPKEGLAMILEANRQSFVEDTTSALAALDALGISAAYHATHGNPKPDDDVTVKWWALEVFWAGFVAYRQACKGKGTLSLDEAFGLAGGGQGKEPKIKSDLRLRRDREIAMAIATRNAPGTSVEMRIAAVASEFGVGRETAWRAWNRHGDKAKDIVERFRHDLPKS